MDVVNIYGDLRNNVELVVGIRNYNIHGLLTYETDGIVMKPITNINSDSIVEVVLTYENETTCSDRIYFSLAVKGSDKYINIKDNSGLAYISDEKANFWIDYSGLDRKPRDQILAGSSYSLKTMNNGEECVVIWKIDGFSSGDLVLFLPTTWYEKNGDNVCQSIMGINLLVEKLQQTNFKGYTKENWCNEGFDINNCSDDDEKSGNCMGYHNNEEHICYIKEGNFICESVKEEPKIADLIPEANPPMTSGTTATWIAIVIVFVLVLLITFGLSSLNSS